MTRLKTTPVSSIADVQQFFDAFASHNVEQHGKADKLLQYRLHLIKKYAGFSPTDHVLDIGCGNGHHLFALDGLFGSATGTDLSAGMIHAAQQQLNTSKKSSYQFLTDDAQQLSQLPDNHFDVVLCIGALEHMFDKSAVLNNAHRVLKPGGRLVFLTLNDQFVWYRHIAPRINYPTRHLATDRRLDYAEAQHLLKEARFTTSGVDFWTFIPKGDMPAFFAMLSKGLDKLGHLFMPASLRGGLILHATK